MIVHVKCHSCAPLLWHIVVNRISQLLLLLILFIFLDFLVSLKVRQVIFDGLRREGQQMSYQEYWFNFEALFNGIYPMLLYKLIFKLLLGPLPETKNGYKYIMTLFHKIRWTILPEAEEGWRGIAKLEQLHLQVLHSLIIKLQFSKW